MSPEYVCENQAGEQVRLFTTKADGFWQGVAAAPVDGVITLTDASRTDKFCSEAQAREQAVNKFGLKITDTWPPRHPNLAFYLGQLRSYLTFEKFRR